MNDLLTVTEVARTLRLSKLAIYRRIADGSLGAIRLGPPPAGRLRIPAAELERFLEASSHEHAKSGAAAVSSVGSGAGTTGAPAPSRRSASAAPADRG